METGVLQGLPRLINRKYMKAMELDGSGKRLDLSAENSCNIWCKLEVCFFVHFMDNI